MKVISSYDTDIGKSKNVNQDALCIKEAQTNYGLFTMAVLCDGMGGYSSGEIASSTIIKVFSEWFEDKLPLLLKEEFSLDKVREQWQNIVKSYSKLTVEYGLKLQPKPIKLGTTITGILITERYGAEIIHAGDSRLYQIKDDIIQITKDHTKVAYRISQGELNLSEYEIEHHPERHILTECIGGSRVTCNSNSYRLNLNSYRNNSSFLLCSDGFRHEISKSEMLEVLNVNDLNDEISIKSRIRHLIDINLQRGEQDNISAILLKIIN